MGECVEPNKPFRGWEISCDAIQLPCKVAIHLESAVRAFDICATMRANDTQYTQNPFAVSPPILSPELSAIVLSLGLMTSLVLGL